MAQPPTEQTSAPKSRFFVALLPPSDVQAKATELKHFFWEHYNSKAALKSPPHITLQAPFEWLDNDRDRLVATLSQFQFQPAAIPVTLSGFGAFPPRVIYLDVEHTPELMQLQKELSQYLEDTLNIFDPRSRDRPFRPHLTVAFRDLKPAAFRRAWPEFEHKKDYFEFSVSKITLLLHTGKEWTLYRQFPLSQAFNQTLHT